MMWMRKTAGTLAALCFVLPGQAWGADAQLSVGGGVEWDNNVARIGQPPEDDFIFRVNPKLRFIEDEGKATWNLFYAPTYENAVESSVVDGFRHYFVGNGSYHLSDATEFFFRDNFQLSDTINTVTALDEQGASIIASADERVLRNNLIVGVQHSFTPRLLGSLSLNHRFFTSDVADRSDNQSYGGNARVRYKYTPLHTFGIGVAATQQDFKRSKSGRVSGSDSLFVNLFGSWEWMVDETTNFEITVGPTFIDSNQAAPGPLDPVPIVPHQVLDDGTVQVFSTTNCRMINMLPVVSQDCDQIRVTDPTDIANIRSPANVTVPMFATPPAPLSDTAWTIFGEAKLSKRWAPNITSELAYSRRDSTASGVGGSSVLDYIYFTTNWQISPVWDTSIRADWTQRQSTSPRNETYFVLVADGVPLNTMGVGALPAVAALTSGEVKRSVDTSRYGAAWRLTRRITERFSVSTRYTYVKQQSAQDSNGASSDFDDHLVTLNFQYDFDRWTLW